MHAAPPAPKTHTDLLRQRAHKPLPDATLREVFAPVAVDGAVTGFALAHLAVRSGKPVLWVQDRLSRREAGVPYLAGIAGAVTVMRVDVSRPVDVLWAVEQGLGCASLGGVIAEIWGDPAQLDFTATKRLALRSEAHGVPCWLIRRAGQPNLSAARERWRVRSLPSGRHPDDARAPGMAHWQAELFRSRFRTPGAWVVRHDRAAGRLHFDHPQPGPTRKEPADAPQVRAL